MDKQTVESLRDLAIQYPLWALFDWMRDTGDGKIFAVSAIGAIVSGIGRILARVRGWEPSTKHTLSVILITCAWIFSVVGLATLLSAPKARSVAIPPSAAQGASVAATSIPQQTTSATPKARVLSAIEYLEIRGETHRLFAEGSVKSQPPYCSIRIRYTPDNDNLAAILYDAFHEGGCQNVTRDPVTSHEDVDSPRPSPLPSGVIVHAVSESLWGDACYNMLLISVPELNVHRGYRAPEAIITATPIPRWEQHEMPLPPLPPGAESVLIDIGPGSPWKD